MANRCFLHISKLEAFKKFLIDNNIAFRPGKGDYEVLQIDIDGIWAKIYRRNEMPEHFTVQDRLMPLVQKFVKEE